MPAVAWVVMMVGGSSLAAPGVGLEPRSAALLRLSHSFVLDQITMGLGPLTTREALLVLAINQANIAALTRDPAARRRYGALEAPAPDDERRPVSVNAIAISLGIPFETVRRHVRGLVTLGVCALTPQGVIVPQTYLASPGYLESVGRSLDRLRLFYAHARDGGLIGPLPPPAYDTDDGAPLRGAARLLSDYILRIAQSAHALAGDMISAIVLLAVLEGSIAGEPRSVAAIARRLAVPEETARRHAVRLAHSGLCVRSHRGPTATLAMLHQEPLASLLREHQVDAQRLFAGLAERGVIAAWEAQGG